MTTPTQRPGAAALIAIVLISAFALAIMVSASLTANLGLGSVTATKSGERALSAAESGLRDAMYRLGNDPNTASYATVLNSIPVTVTITPSGFIRTIRSSGHDQAGDTTRTVSINVNVSTFTGGFGGAVQLATKLQADNGSTIDGNVLVGSTTTSGTICSGTAGCGGTGATFQNGDVAVAGNGGSATNVTLAGNYNLKAHTIDSSTAGGKAFYQHVSGTVKAAGTTCHDADTGPNCNGGAADPVAQNFPMTDANITTIKGYVPGANLVNNNLTITSDQTLGATAQTAPCNVAPYNCQIGTTAAPKNVTINGATWTLKSTVLWITGNLTLQHSGDKIVLDPSLGANSATIIVDGTISLGSPNQKIQGSGNANSFVLVISTKTDAVNDVIYTKEGSDSAILFAPHGVIEVDNGGFLNNATGYKLHLDNGATVKYTSGISTFTIPPSGNPQPPTVVTNSWQEL